MVSKYKFEKFRNPDFPVYSSRQQGIGEIVVPHYHESAELIRILRGSVEMIIGTQKLILKSNEFAFIPPFGVHSVIGLSEDSQIEGLVFELSLITPCYGKLGVEKILTKEKITDFIINENNPIFADLCLEFDRALQTYEKPNIAYELKMLAHIFALTAILADNYYIEDREYESYDRLAPVFKYIAGNYQKNISLSDLSCIINVCDDHLIRLFKNSVNKSPIKYINDLRIQEAMKLLINTEFSVTQIAYKVGFSDPNYMTRLFKNTLDITPGQYRKKAIKNNRESKA